MHSPDEGVETIAELIARLVYEYEARQATRAKKVNKPTKSVALHLPLSPHPQPRK